MKPSIERPLNTIKISSRIIIMHSKCKDPMYLLYCLKHSNLESDAFYFVRHGKTEWEFPMIRFGPVDLALNKMGVDISTKTASLIKNRERVGYNVMLFSSDLKRCTETSDILNKYCKIKSLIIKTGIRERNFGDWSVYKKS